MEATQRGFSILLRQWRKDHGLKESVAARELGVSTATGFRSPLPGLMGVGGLFQWLTPPANFQKPSGLNDFLTGIDISRPIRGVTHNATAAKMALTQPFSSVGFFSIFPPGVIHNA